MFSLLPFFLVGQQLRHWRNGCASSCSAQSCREIFQIAITLTGQLKPWLYTDTKTLWSKFKERYEKWKKINYCSCLSEKIIKTEASAISSSELGNNRRLVSCSPRSLIFIPFAASGLTSGRRTTSAGTLQGVSFSGDIQDPPGQGPVQSALGDRASAGGLD